MGGAITKREGGKSGGGGEEHQMEAGREVEDSLCQAGVSIRREAVHLQNTA